jgi:hypothetical protein
MTVNDLMREACEAAGLRHDEVWDRGTVRYHDKLGSSWGEEDKALPAYVAELLVAQIVAYGPMNRQLHRYEHLLHRHVGLGLGTAPARVRIAGAMYGMKKWDIITTEQFVEGNAGGH